jgi:spermidine/putrescine-binding protein
MDSTALLSGCRVTLSADSGSLCGSSAHYVGYVEDDETPEAIMKKFEALERVQKQHAGRHAGDDDMQAAEAPEACGEGAQGEQVLTEEVLLEVFKQTSAFNVKTVQHNGVSALSLTGRPEFTTTPGRGAVQR